MAIEGIEAILARLEALKASKPSVVRAPSKGTATVKRRTGTTLAPQEAPAPARSVPTRAMAEEFLTDLREIPKRAAAMTDDPRRREGLQREFTMNAIHGFMGYDRRCDVLGVKLSQAENLANSLIREHGPAPAPKWKGGGYSPGSATYSVNAKAHAEFGALRRARTELTLQLESTLSEWRKLPEARVATEGKEWIAVIQGLETEIQRLETEIQVREATLPR